MLVYNLNEKYVIPFWYLLGVFVLNLLSFGIYFAIIKSQDVFLAGILNILNFFVIVVWFFINAYLVINLVKEGADRINFVLPIYFVILEFYMLFLFYLAWFRDMYISKSISDYLTVFTTLFELGFAFFMIYKKRTELEKNHALRTSKTKGKTADVHSKKTENKKPKKGAAKKKSKATHSKAKKTFKKSNTGKSEK